MGWLDRMRRLRPTGGAGAAPAGELTEARPAPAAPVMVARQGYEYGIPRGGINEIRGSHGTATQADRRTMLGQLYEAYLACPWSWAAVQAIARTVTAGGVQAEWDGDDGEGDRKAPPKPEPVLAMERLFKFVNPREDIRQLLRGVITDLLVFADAYLEVVWIGNTPVALYSLDSPSMYPIADEHGVISGYKQVTEFGQTATFEPREVIHISLDSPRSGIFGVGPTQAALLPITAWLYAAATVKETFRKGNPPTVHVDMPAGMSPTEINKWDAEYAVRNIGPRNIGTPIITKGGGVVNELQQGQISDYLATLDQRRDEILAAYGVPPAKAGVIESGNLGGGTGEAQDKTFRENTCNPLADLIMEKINYHLGVLGFGMTEWQFKLAQTDIRDSKTVEEIRDMRVRNGLLSLNKARTEIGEPPVDGGDDPLLIEGTHLVLWRHLEALSAALVAKEATSGKLEVEEPEPGEPLVLIKPEPEPIPPELAKFAGIDPGQQTPPGAPGAGGQPPGAPGGTTPADEDEDQAVKKGTREALAAFGEAFAAALHRSLTEAIGIFPVAEHAAEPGDRHSDHDHHDRPDYTAADLGVAGLERITVDPGTLRVDHEHYQRPRNNAKVLRLAEQGADALAGRLGLLARRPDGTLWIVDGQHHTAAGYALGLTAMTYQVFDSTGPQMERRVFGAWQRWDKAGNQRLRELAGVG